MSEHADFLRKQLCSSVCILLVEICKSSASIESCVIDSFPVHFDVVDGWEGKISKTQR